MTSILSRYIFKETAQTWIVVTFVLLLILMTNQFAQVLGDAASNLLPKEAVFLVMGLTSVQYLTILIPIGLFLAIMISLGLLYRDIEMSALRASNERGVAEVSLATDIERVAAVREAIGPDIRLAVDANGAWDVATAVKMGRAMEPFDIYWYEEPVWPDDVDGRPSKLPRGRDMGVGGSANGGDSWYPGLLFL